MATILCIDDESDLRNDVIEELQDSGYETLEAVNGKDGLEIILRDQPDLVLCDVTMPVMNGHELIRELRQNHPAFANLPFIFLSALADRDAQLKGRAEGGDDYMTKPVDYELLLATVGARLRQVERMEVHKEEQMVRLYKAVAVEPSKWEEFSARESIGNMTDAAEIPPQAVEAPETKNDCGETFSEAVAEAMQSESKSLIAGRVQLVGLNEVKKSLGDSWQGMAEKAYEIAEKTIRRHLDPRDILRKDKNGDFVVCFADLSEQEAACKAQLIKHEVGEKLLGTQAGELGLDSAQIEAATMQSISQVDAESHELDLKDAKVNSGNDAFDLINAKLQAAAQRAGELAKDLLKELIDTATLELRAVKMKNRSPAPFQLSEFDKNSRAKIQKILSFGNDPVSIQCELDMLHLSKASEALVEAMASGETGMTTIGVHCSTLLNRRYLERYRQLCESLPDALRHALVIVVRDIPEDLHAPRTHEVINQIRPFARVLALEVRSLSMHQIDPETTRAPIVVLETAGIKQLLTQDAQEMRQFFSAIHGKRAKVLIENPPKVEAVEDLWRAGADFIASERK